MSRILNTTIYKLFIFSLITVVQGYPPWKNLWLFNLDTDPQETLDVSDDYPEVVEMLVSRLAAYNATAVPVCDFPRDPDGANPDLNGGVWMPWIEL